MFQTTPRSQVSQSVMQEVAQLIRAEEYVIGDRLPGERRLAEELDVSRSSVREALRRLEVLGIVEIRPGLGTFVRDPTSSRIQTALVPYIRIDDSTLRKLFELREIIEVEAAARAAERANAADINAMQETIDRLGVCSRRNDLDGMVMADVEFHRRIVIATGNEILVDLMDSAAELLHDMRRANMSIPERLPSVTADHRNILKAIQDRDAARASTEMKEHLNKVRALVAAYRSEE